MGKSHKTLLQEINEEMEEIAKIKLVHHQNFSDPKNPHFLTLQFYGEEKRIEKLVAHINTHIGERNAPAYLQWTNTQTAGDNNVKYTTTVFPHDHIPRDRQDLESATDSFVRKMPHAIKDYITCNGGRHW